MIKSEAEPGEWLKERVVCERNYAGGLVRTWNQMKLPTALLNPTLAPLYPAASPATSFSGKQTGIAGVVESDKPELEF